MSNVLSADVNLIPLAVSPSPNSPPIRLKPLINSLGSSSNIITLLAAPLTGSVDVYVTANSNLLSIEHLIPEHVPESVPAGLGNL